MGSSFAARIAGQPANKRFSTKAITSAKIALPVSNTKVRSARSAMKRGELSYEQLEDLVLFMTQYVGYPKASKLRLQLMGLKPKD